MDVHEELIRNKDNSSQNITYFDDKYDIPNQVNLLPATNVLNNPCSSVTLPPPLPGVFVFEQPNQKTNKFLMDSNFEPLVTSSYDSNAQTLSNTGPPYPNQYQKHIDRPSSEITSSQKYFQSPSSSVYDYQNSEEKKLNRLQPTVISDVDSLLPPQGNVYQSLEPVPVNIFDASPYCEPRVYQQLEPVSSNEYRVDMEKFVEQKFYQELNPLSVNDSKMPKNEKKTYQQLRSVPDLRSIEEQSDMRNVTIMTEQKPEIPPEYATSKLYQQLSKPPKKQVRKSHPPEVKSYHQLTPPGFVDRPKHNLSKSVSQRVSLNAPRPVTTQASPSPYYQHQNNSQTYHPQPYETFQNVKVNSYDNNTNMIDPTINITPKPNLNFPNKTQLVQRGFQEHKPKIYLELRNPLPRTQTSTSPGRLQAHLSIDQPYQDAVANYADGNITRRTNTPYQSVHPLHSHVNNKKPSMRLPSPYEFKFSQTNTFYKSRMPNILDPSEYNNSQQNLRADQMLHTSTNHSLNESVSSSTLTPQYHVGEEISAGNIHMTSLSKTPVCFGSLKANGAGNNCHKDLNLIRIKTERNELPTQVVSHITPVSVPHITNQPVDSNHANYYDNDSKRITVVKEESNLTQKETDFNSNSNTLDSEVSIEKSVSNDGTADDTNTSNCNIEKRSTTAEDTSKNSFSEFKSYAPDFGPKLVMSSTTGNSHSYSTCVDSNQNKALSAGVSNIEDLSNPPDNIQSINKVAVNNVHNEVNGNIESLTRCDIKNRLGKNLKPPMKPLCEEPTDLSRNIHAFKQISNSNCINKDYPLSAEPFSGTPKTQNSCSVNNKEISSSFEVTSSDTFLNESKCLKSSNSSYSIGVPSTDIFDKVEPQFCINESDKSVLSHSTVVFSENDIVKNESLSPIGKKKKALTTGQSSVKLNIHLPDQILGAGSSEPQLASTVDRASSQGPNVSPNQNIESVQSDSQTIKHEENKDSSQSYDAFQSSEANSGQSPAKLRAQSDILKNDQSKPVETVSALNSDKSVGDLCKSVERNEKLSSESFINTQYSSFIPKKKRILYKTQLLPTKGSIKSYPEISTDSKSMVSLSEQSSVLPETSSFGKAQKTQSECFKTVKPISTVFKESFKTSETGSIINNDNCSSDVESNISSELVGKIAEHVMSSDRTQLIIEEKEKLSCGSLDVNQTTVLVKNNVVVSETKNISPSSECIVTQSNVKSFTKSKWQQIRNEDKAEIETSLPQFLVSGGDSVSLETQSSTKKEKRQPMSKNHKILSLEQHSDRSQTPPSPVEEQNGLNKFQIGPSKKRSHSESCNTVSSTSKNNKKGVDETGEIQCQSPNNKSIVSEQGIRSSGTRSSMKRKVKDGLGRMNEPNSKSIAKINESESYLEDSVKTRNPSSNKSVKSMHSHSALVTCDPDVTENKDDVNKSVGKSKPVVKHLTADKSKSPRVVTLQEKTSLKSKRKYCKRKKIDVLSTVKKAEPLLKSKYSKRIIKKKKLDFEPVEPVRKPKTLLKRKYTITKHKNLPIKQDGGENQTSTGQNTTPSSAKIKYEFVDPLEKGLISDDEGEAVFLGFDSPQEEDDTVLGFDFEEDEDDDMEPINEFLQQLDADSMTVECDPRTLLEAPDITTQCPQCDQALDSHQDLVVNHMRLHTSQQSHDTGLHMCRVCLREFATRAKLDKHTKWNHEGGKRFSCPVCSKRFTTSYYVKKHLATVHGQHKAELKYICPDCTVSFKSEKKLVKHVDKVHKKTLYQCNKCLKNFLKLANLERHKRSHEVEGQSFPCAYCNEKFDNRAQLHAHWPVHSEKKLFTCEICNSTFTTLPSMKRHKILHAGEKLFRCDICQKTFALMSTLKTHLLVHSGIKRFPCKLCDKTFNRQDVLNAHQWIHTGEKNFECDICFQKFRWRHAVKSHKLIYHCTEKPYECEVCGKRFSHPESFKKHGEVHAEKLYYCQICLKAFSRPSSLKIHILIHTDLKPFVCDLCNKGFRHKGHLRKHFLVHTSEKPWLCKFCNRMYKDRSQLRRHKRVVHCKDFFKKVLPGVPESLKTVENFEMIAKGESLLHTDQECSQESNVLDSENLRSRSSKHFILSNIEGGFSHLEDNSVSDSMEDNASNTDETEVSSANVEDNTTDTEENYIPQTNVAKINGPQENVLSPSAF